MNRLFFITFLLFATSGYGYSEENLSRAISELSARLGTKSNIVVADLKNSRIIYEKDAHTKVKPASILKLITSGVALSMLGPDYRFQTEFWSDSLPGKDGSIQTLYVKGGGDPSFTIEDMLMVIRTMKRRGIKKIGSIILDDHLFDESNGPVGQRAYQAGSSALSFNFNTIAFEVCPTNAGSAATVVPDPSEIPVVITGQISTNSKAKTGFNIDNGTPAAGTLNFKVGGYIARGSGCQMVYRSVVDPTTYFGQSLIGLLKSNGIKVKTQPVRGQLNKNTRLITRHESKPLSQIVWDLNHYSTNFISEQLVYKIGFSRSEELSRATGLARMGMYLEKLGFPRDHFDLYDGSGLSHQNRVTAMSMVKVLIDIHKNQRIWPEFESSLAVAGQSGTLRKRLRGLKGGVVRAKTGSLNGVTSLAGYVNTDRGNSFAFVVITNGGTNFSRARKLEEDLVKTIIAKT